MAEGTNTAELLCKHESPLETPYRVDNLGGTRAVFRSDDDRALCKVAFGRSDAIAFSMYQYLKTLTVRCHVKFLDQANVGTATGLRYHIANVESGLSKFLEASRIRPTKHHLRLAAAAFSISQKFTPKSFVLPTHVIFKLRPTSISGRSSKIQTRVRILKQKTSRTTRTLDCREFRHSKASQTYNPLSVLDIHNGFHRLPLRYRLERYVANLIPPAT